MYRKRTEEMVRLAHNGCNKVDSVDVDMHPVFSQSNSLLCPITGNFIQDEISVQDDTAISAQVDTSLHIYIDNDAASTHISLCPITGEFIYEKLPEQSTDISVTKSIKENKKKRTLGKKYIGFKKVGDKYMRNDMKPDKTMNIRCSHKDPKRLNKNSYRCEKLTEEDRNAIFNQFWQIKTWGEKKAFLNGLVTSRKIRRRRSVTTQEKKTKGHDMYLPALDGMRYKVCSLMLINTVGIKRSTFGRWMDKSNSEETIPTPSSRSFQKTERRENIKRWLDLLPKVPSHYCRSSSSRTYVESTFLSILDMYSVYKTWCETQNIKSVGRNIFTEVLEAEKVSIHRPRKDQCDICISHKCGTIPQEEYNKHIIRKEKAQEAKKKAKEEANGSTLVLTMDLQSVLLCPKLEASMVYYKQKLQVHNFTIYVLNNSDVTLYTWHEADGGVTANEFTSCIVDFIDNLPLIYTKIILISDGCNYQNRNRTLASALSNQSKLKGVEIQQLFLEKGHTMMEADNVHSVLEHYFKPPIYSPMDYISRMQLARSKQPYKIKNIHYDFFLNYEISPSNLKSLRPGKKAGDPVVNDIRALKYSYTGEIYYKIDQDKDWIELPQRRKPGYHPPLPLYQSQLKLSTSKLQHLQDLKTVIDKNHHPFYDSLSAF